MRCLLLAFALPLVACGDDNSNRHLDAHLAGDGPNVPDGPTPDTLSSAVTLTVTLADGTPNAGVHVYFQNADSSPVAAMLTDATGTASATMAAGGYVTAVNPFVPPLFGKAPDDLRTFGGVKPGDHLRLVQLPTFIGLTVNVTAPPDPNAAAVSYVVAASCGSGELVSPSGSGMVNATGTVFLAGCNGTADIMIVTLDNNGIPLDFIWQPATAVVDQGNLDFTAAAYVGASQRTYTYNNTPTIDSTFDIRDGLVTARGLIYQQFTNQTLSNAPPIVFTQNLPDFTGAYDVVQTIQSAPGVTSTRNILDWAPYTNSYTIDYNAHLVADIVDFPVFDSTLHQLTWTESGGTLAPQVVYLQMGVFRPTPFNQWNWTIAAPHGASLVFPVLPSDVYDWNVAASDNTNLQLMFSANVPGGYDAVRAGILSLDVQGAGLSELVNATPGQVSYAFVEQVLLTGRKHRPNWAKAFRAH